MIKIDGRILGALTWLSCSLLSCWLAVAAVAQQSGDPYQLRFDDFQWTQPTELTPLAGTRSLGNRMPTAKAIAMFESRLQNDSQDVAALMMLGELYLVHAKEEDDLPAYDQSEQMLRRALELSPESSSAQLHLAQTLLAKHRFAEARKLASSVLERASDSPFALATMFDATLELGDYAAAKLALDKLLELERSAPVLAREARLAELMGDTQRAIGLLQQCVDTEPESAWYQWRLGGLQFNSGQTAAAIAAHQAALQLDPGNGPSQVDLAVCYFSDGQPELAKKLLSDAVSEHGEPPMMMLLGDLHMVSGEHQLAEEWYQRTEQAMREEAKIAGDAHAREVALFLADHDRDLPRALELAQRDLQIRQDIFAYDALAWIHYKLGDVAAASVAISKAVAHGTRSPQIVYHAALIAEASGRRDEAKDFWNILGETNPKFSILHSNTVKTGIAALSP